MFLPGVRSRDWRRLGRPAGAWGSGAAAWILRPSIPRTIARRIRDIIAPQDPADLFPEMAFSLFAFVALPHRSVQGRETPLCFLSHKGQSLMRLYEIYRGPTGDPPIRYLETSRRFAPI
jgi:hypothetical protein